MEAFYIVVLVSTTLVLLAAFSSLLAFRFGAPLLLLFLAIGLLAGSDGLGIQFSNNPSTGRKSTLSAPSLDGVQVFDGGVRTRTLVTVGISRRF